jgi:uncharacterized membrane protein (UPF0127 family)
VPRAPAISGSPLRRVIKRSLKLLVQNITRGTVVGDAIDKADTSAKRRTGLLKHTGLNEGGGLWIVPCESIHMFFMKFALDVIYIDRKLRVKKVVRNLKPWGMSACLSAHSVIELPVGTIDRTGTQAGDELRFPDDPSGS